MLNKSNTIDFVHLNTITRKKVERISSKLIKGPVNGITVLMGYKLYGTLLLGEMQPNRRDARQVGAIRSNARVRVVI